MRYFVTGGAGFIGSHLVDGLIAAFPRDQVIAFDNLSTGKKIFLHEAQRSGRVKLIIGDLLNSKSIQRAISGCEFVFHLAANPDISLSVKNPRIDFEQGIITTHNLLEAMRKKGINKIAFSSSSVVYGEPTQIPTPEDYGPLTPISIYGASKLSGEGLISAYRHMFGFQAWIFRFPNVIGPRATHGVIYDFLKKLRKNPKELLILGNGKQEKSYLYVSDCVRAMLFCILKSKERLNIFNLGSKTIIQVNDIAKTVIDSLGLKNVKISYSGGSRGWKGDVPRMNLSLDKLCQLGFKQNFTAKQALRNTIKELILCKQ